MIFPITSLNLLRGLRCILETVSSIKIRFYRKSRKWMPVVHPEVERTNTIHRGSISVKTSKTPSSAAVTRFKVIVPIRTQSERRKDTDSPPLSPSKLLTAKLLVAKAKAARRPKVKLDLGDVVSVKKAAASSNRSAVKYLLVVPFGRAFCYPFLSLSLLFPCLSDIRRILDLKYCPIPACFDTVLANEGDGGIMGVDGYRVAQVRVVTLTSQATSVLFPAGPVKPPTHLAYVE
ncbi:hypothetical protein F4604DRAFT_1690267 [Suillus subluteus]|nr:hypothetical protein F4604DRAFT_1690267 [Suillus subluteus]